MEMPITFIKMTFSAFIGTMVSWLGGTDGILNLLFLMIVADILTGFMKGLYTKSINTEKIWLGGFKKISILLVVVVAHQMSFMLGSAVPLREITIIYYIVQEGLSFIENVSVFTSVPEEVTDFFDKLNNKGDEEV